MTKIILSGCGGSMGRTVVSCAAGEKGCEIVAGIDLKENPDASFPVFRSPEEVNTEADVLIDFSNPSLLTPLLQFGIGRKIPLVLCTTWLLQGTDGGTEGSVGPGPCVFLRQYVARCQSVD
jgi:4-hydroxy-tetrahydrodipicolinate reductase